MNLLIVFIVLIIIAIAIVAAILLLRNNSKGGNTGANTKKTAEQIKANDPVNAFLPSLVWGEFKANRTNDGRCQNYTLSAGQYNPATPSYQDLNEGGGRGYIITNQKCLDIDQIFAQAGSHTCEKSSSGSAGTGCISSANIPYVEGNVGKIYPPGTLVPVGTVEGVYGDGTTSSYPYYVPCNVPNNSTNAGAAKYKYCDGTIGLIVPQFTPTTVYNSDTLCNAVPGQNLCLAFDNANIPPYGNRKYYNVNLENCSLGNFTEIFRVTRYSLDSDYNLVPDTIGKLASITYRINGYYLAPDMQNTQDLTLNKTNYIFDKPIIDDDLSFTERQNTIRMQLINPVDDIVRNGVYWLLQDQTANPTYNVNEIPVQQYFGCNIRGIPFPQGANPLGPSCPVGGLPSFYLPGTTNIPAVYRVNTAPISPQQFVYVPDLKQVPDTSEQSDLWTYLINQYSLTITSVNSVKLPVLQQFRAGSSLDIFTTDCSNIKPGITGKCVRQYDPSSSTVFPMVYPGTFPYPDSQFLSYRTFVEGVTKGVSPTSPGCRELSSKFSGNIFNPFGSKINILISTTAN
jgi:hypothetical protein